MIMITFEWEKSVFSSLLLDEVHSDQKEELTTLTQCLIMMDTGDCRLVERDPGHSSLDSKSGFQKKKSLGLLYSVVCT